MPRDFAFARDPDLAPLQPDELEPEMKLAVTYDLLYRALKAARKRNAVPDFIQRLEGLVRTEIHQFPELRDEVYGAMRKGPAAGKDFLFPRDIDTLERAKRHCVEAIAEYRAWETMISRLRK
jgi:hypothetical protein